MFGSNASMIINDNQGFSKIVRKIQNPFKSHVLLKKHVTKIVRTKRYVKVNLKDGSKYTADYVIVTFSVGVLQQREVVFFNLNYRDGNNGQ